MNLLQKHLKTSSSLVFCLGCIGWSAWASQQSKPVPAETLDIQFEGMKDHAQSAFEAYEAPGEPAQPKQIPSDVNVPTVAPSPTVLVAPGQSKRKKRIQYKPSTLVVVTNFEKATILVNGKTYPSDTVPGVHTGMVLPAGGPYVVEVTYDGKKRSYTLSLRPYEKRYLIVELSGYKGAVADGPSPKKSKVSQKPPIADVKKGGETGRVTVYAKPRGVLILDGKDTGKKAPNTVTASLGRHEVQVRYTDGEVSEKKIVRVRKNSRIKLFFRQRKKK